MMRLFRAILVAVSPFAVLACSDDAPEVDETEAEPEAAAETAPPPPPSSWGDDDYVVDGGSGSSSNDDSEAESAGDLR